MSVADHFFLFLKSLGDKFVSRIRLAEANKTTEVVVRHLPGGILPGRKEATETLPSQRLFRDSISKEDFEEVYLPHRISRQDFRHITKVSGEVNG